MREQVSIKLHWLCLLTAFLWAGHTYALDSWAYAVEAHAEVTASPPSIKLTWPRLETVREYKISRKALGENSWRNLATVAGTSTGYTDSDVSVGTPFEYEIAAVTTHLSGTDWVTAYSYLWAGINVPLQDSKGKVLLVVDSSISASVAAELKTFETDLVGGGWQVIRREVGRSAPVNDVKNLIRGEYNADPANVRSIVLIGHVPVPYSGAIAPDLHGTHLGAWPADSFYAEMDGQWTDHVVHATDSVYSENHNVPGDGKFDQSEIPGLVELEIGRIDFANLPAFSPRTEVDLLRNYFRKNHQFRHRQFTLPRQGIIRDNFGDLAGDAPAVDGWRHFTGFFGPENIREVGEGSFLPTLANEGFLWSYGCGGGGDDKADGVGSTYDLASTDPKTAFFMLHGSWFGDWDRVNNFLRASIATPNYTLASVWTGLPHWYLHHMALGRTIGFATRLSQNNRDLYKSHKNFSAHHVHVSLIGDPTLEMFPVAPPHNLRAQVGTGVDLAWDAAHDDSIVGYHVYEATNANGPFQRITSTPTPETRYAHPAGSINHYYQVRTIKLERTGSGTYYNASTGIILHAKDSPPNQPPTISTIPDQTINENGSTAPIAFRIDDAESAASALQVWATSVDPLLVPEANIIFGGSANERTVTVTPASGRSGSANITVFVSDGISIGSQSFYLHVLKFNEPPVAHSATIELLEDIPRHITLSGSDAEGSVLKFKEISDPGKGSLSGTPPELTYTPFPNETGTDSVTFTVSDGEKDSAPGLITLNIIPLNDPPVLSPLGDLILGKNVVPAPIPFTLTDVDTPVESVQLRASSSNPDFLSSDQIQITGTGTAKQIQLLLEASVAGSTVVTVEAVEGTESTQREFTITVTNAPPMAEDDSVRSQPNFLRIEIAELLKNDSDPDGDRIELVQFAGVTEEGGMVERDDSYLIYTPRTGFTGNDAFSYTIEDSSGASSQATVFIEVEIEIAFSSIELRPDGQLLLRCQGPPMERFDLEASTDTENWTVLGEIHLDETGQAEFEDVRLGTNPFRIYRLEKPQ